MLMLLFLVKSCKWIYRIRTIYRNFSVISPIVIVFMKYSFLFVSWEIFQKLF